MIFRKELKLVKTEEALNIFFVYIVNTLDEPKIDLHYNTGKTFSEPKCTEDIENYLKVT